MRLPACLAVVVRVLLVYQPSQIFHKQRNAPPPYGIQMQVWGGLV